MNTFDYGAAGAWSPSSPSLGAVPWDALSGPQDQADANAVPRAAGASWSNVASFFSASASVATSAFDAKQAQARAEAAQANLAIEERRAMQAAQAASMRTPWWYYALGLGAAVAVVGGGAALYKKKGGKRKNGKRRRNKARRQRRRR